MQGGGHRGRGERGHAPSAPGEPPARSRITRYRPTTKRRRPGRRKQSGPLGGRPGEGGGANQGEEITPPLPPPPPPPRRTDPLAADQAAPDAHGRPATPTAQVYPRGARAETKDGGPTPDGAGGRGAVQQPPFPSPPPPAPPPARGPQERRPPGANRSRGDAPPPPERTATRGRGAAGPARRAPQRPPPPAPAGVAADGRARTSTPERRADHARGRHAATNQSSMGAAPPMTRASPVTHAMLPTRGGRREGLGLTGPPGERFAGRTSPPPPLPGRPHPVYVGGIRRR